jgi:cell filamentation protein
MKNAPSKGIDLPASAPSTAWRRLLAIHHDLLGGEAADAGALRQTPKASDGAHFARPDLIIPSLVAAFVALETDEESRVPDRAAYFDVLAAHLATLYAIQPFEVGNRRVLAAYASEVAQSVGYTLTPCALDESLWDEALWRGFVHLDPRGIACLLSGASPPEDYANTPAIGISGIPLFPERDAPAARRYLMSLAKARRELHQHLPDARDEALDRLESLIAGEGAPAQIDTAQQALSLLRHAKGPMFQLTILEHTGFDRIEPVINPQQSAFERVQEIAAAIAIGLNQQPRGVIERAAHTVQQPFYSAGASPHQDRLAAEFLRNTAATNRADPRFAAAQAIVDNAATAAAADATRNPEAILAAANAARTEVARKIRLGELPPPLVVNDDGVVVAAPRVTKRATRGTAIKVQAT